MFAFGRLSAAAAVSFFLRGALCNEGNVTEFIDNVTDAFSGNPVKTCKDVVNVSDGADCFANVTWAMLTGIVTEPAFYANYTTLNASSSRVDFQCALADMVGADEAGKGHGCPVPCTSSLPQCAAAKDIAATASESSGFPWWAWLLILCPLLLLCGGLAYYFLVLNKKDGAKKKKRATKAPAPPAAPAAPVVEAAPAESVLVAPPVYVNSTSVAAPLVATPVYTAAPVARTMTFATAAPVQTSSSFVAVAAPATYAAPVAQYATPATTYTAAPVAQYTVPAEQ
jgi:hypothetical protein